MGSTSLGGFLSALSTCFQLLWFILRFRESKSETFRLVFGPLICAHALTPVCCYCASLTAYWRVVQRKLYCVDCINSCRGVRMYLYSSTRALVLGSTQPCIPRANSLRSKTSILDALWTWIGPGVLGVYHEVISES